MKKSQYTNHLIHEKSPYLLQHAHNPVDWYPWCQKALNLSIEHDKLIFLSIGYATCHWCHVMEREVFKNEEIAKEMNDLFINIKVDREELPQVDAYYMELAQTMMGGALGWPLNLVLTPDLKPIFAATFLPAQSQYNLLGMKEMIEQIREAWGSEEREKISMQASSVIELLKQNKKASGFRLPYFEVIENATEMFYKIADPAYGGLKGSPKFPIGYQQTFLMAYSAKSKDSRALFLAEKTLQMMYQGGIYDHLGGGFSRYSVDEKWLVPHFEKMLYDNALLAEAYASAWQLTKKPLYRQVAEETYQYVLRDMTHQSGGFFSAEDSETHGEEGTFYTWLHQDVIHALGDGAEEFCDFYNITPEGNFHGRNILNITLDTEAFASSRGIVPEELQKSLKALKTTLWKIRETADHPFKDKKILASWNGLMIQSLAHGGRILQQPDYLDAAVNTARFIKKNLWTGEELLRRYIDNDAAHPGTLEDYAFIIRACLTLFEADCGNEWLLWAFDLCEILTSLFKAQDGAFYQTSLTDTTINFRNVQFSDGSEPSGNAIHAENLLRLYELTVNPRYLSEAEDIFRAVDSRVESYPLGYLYHIMNLQRYYDTHPITIVVALNEQEDNRTEIFRLIFGTFIPHLTVVWRRQNDRELFKMLPFVENQRPIEGQSTVYICHKGVCKEPLTDLHRIEEVLNADLLGID